MSTRPKESTWDFIKTFLWAIAIAMVFRSFCYEPFHIPSGSMRSTLLEGDYIFVSKLSYGYSRYSFPFGSRSLFDGFTGRILETVPERGDVIVFRKPSDTRIDYIKRLIGLPGDKIYMVGGTLYINGEKVRTERIDDIVTVENGKLLINYQPVVLTEADRMEVKNGMLTINGETVHTRTGAPKFEMKDGTLYVDGERAAGVEPGLDELNLRQQFKAYPFTRRLLETLPNGVKHVVLDMYAQGEVDNTEVYTVPENSYFFMGDNRDASQDSRYQADVGYVPDENLIGHAQLIALSPNPNIAFTRLLAWLKAMRWDRSFMAID